MHDLVNDLAQIASSNLCMRLEDIEASHILEQSRHISYSMGQGDFEKLKPLYKLEQLRTLLPINIQQNSCRLSKRVLHDILPRLISLRALSLSQYENEELPNDLFIKLKHLRFLDLSWTKIKKLPDSICLLYNLETLLLSNCSYLEELPLQMEKLINLRHLDIRKVHFRTSLHLSKLKSLHVLVGAKFLLSDRGGLRMEDLGELHNLYGPLSILGLQHVVDRRESLKANMREKEHVETLSLVWSGSIADNSQTERDILDERQPNTNIKEVRITGYRGTKIPNWLADHSFHKLIEVSLSYCKDCDSLPALGQLPCLKFLTIRGMHQITEVSEEFYGSLSSTKPFNSLEKLEFAEMPEWKQWDVLGKGEFPVLEELSIDGCPKLIGKLPENLSSLTRLRISKCPELSLETPIRLSNLKEIQVAGCSKVGVLFDDAQLFTSQLEGLKQIVELCISNCKSVTSLRISILPSTLKRIRISFCQLLKSLTSLEYLCANSLPQIQSLLEEGLPSSLSELNLHSNDDLHSLPTEGLQRLIWLQRLHICLCPNLQSLPESGLPSSLSELGIWNCSNLQSLPKSGMPPFHL